MCIRDSSPTGAAVSPQSPRNLLLMAGTLEPRFAASGRDLLARPALKVMGLGAAQKVADRAATWLFTGPDEEAQHQGRTYLWARASGPDGAAEAWLETGEVYRFTALAGVRLVERVLAAGKRAAPPLAGALTPAGAFGADFVLDIEGVRRFDSLPGKS